jgi:hypothetical protein
MVAILGLLAVFIANAMKTGRFLPRSARWIEEMEKRSQRRIRDLDVLAASTGPTKHEL